VAELDLWMGFLDRDDVQALDPADRMALLSVAVSVADNEPDDDGFLPRTALRSVPWGQEGPSDLAQRIKQLAADGFLVWTDEPAGWHLVGWLDEVMRFKAGNAETTAIAWGQRSSAHWKKVREDAKERQRRFRAKPHKLPSGIE
jgi:hypothetical protein